MRATFIPRRTQDGQTSWTPNARIDESRRSTGWRTMATRTRSGLASQRSIFAWLPSGRRAGSFGCANARTLPATPSPIHSRRVPGNARCAASDPALGGTQTVACFPVMTRMPLPIVPGSAPNSPMSQDEAGWSGTTA